jgi:hypothetical protein
LGNTGRLRGQKETGNIPEDNENDRAGRTFNSSEDVTSRKGPTQSSPLALADGPASGMVHSGDQGAPADEIDPQNTAEARVMRLRGYGNAIVGPQAEAFIKAFMSLQP